VPQSDIARLYDKLSRGYDLWAGLTESKARRLALKLAAIRDGSTVLEVAVGTGLAFEQIVRRNPQGKNVGVDLSSGMLAKAYKRLAKGKHNNYSLTQGSADALALTSGSIDVLVNGYMFDLIPFEKMDAILREFKRVLKPSGKLVMVNMTAGRGFGSTLYERIYRLFPRAMGGCSGVVLSERLQRLGFRVKTRAYVQQFLFPSEVILALNE
jgi:ubiquinone/menaquinone biosynthesis C-methylase UbiE